MIDLGLTLVLGVLFFASGRPDDVGGVAIGLVYIGSLIWRRQGPLAVTLIATAAYSTWVLAGYTAHPLGALPAALAVYTLGQSDERPILKGTGLAVLLGAFLVIAVGMTGMDLLEAAFFVSLFAGIWGVGVVLAGRRRYAAELESARRALAHAAVSEERARIARELHDVVSHSLSTITLQAGVGAHLAKSDPNTATETLKTIETTGRATLDELRRVLGSIGDEANARHPQPSLSDVESLVSSVESSGLDVELSIAGTPGPLPHMVELSIYRVVQESLTNAIKHAPGSRTRVSIEHGANGIEVEVVSEGASNAGRIVGMGIRGMRERVSLLGGDFEAGPSAQGWRVWASIPGSDR